MLPVRSNSNLFNLRLLKEIDPMPQLSDSQRRYDAYIGLVDYERERLFQDCSTRRSLSLDPVPVPVHMEPSVCGYPSYPSPRLLPPLKRERSLFNRFKEPTLLGSIIQNYSSEMRTNELLINRVNSLGLPETVSSSSGESFSAAPCGPTEHDVVCSRGKVFYSLPGNVRFRKTIRAYIPTYLAASSKMDKSAIIDRIIHTALNASNGSTRFLKYQSRTGEWSVMGQDQVRDKVGHALREAIYDMERESKIKSTSSPKKVIRW